MLSRNWTNMKVEDYYSDMDTLINNSNDFNGI